MHLTMSDQILGLNYSFGSSGYKAWYRYKTGEDVVILSIKHQREIGFK
jgi:plasmid stabilization system protein ParE